MPSEKCSVELQNFKVQPGIRPLTQKTCECTKIYGQYLAREAGFPRKDRQEQKMVGDWILSVPNAVHLPDFLAVRFPLKRK